MRLLDGVHLIRLGATLAFAVAININPSMAQQPTRPSGGPAGAGAKNLRHRPGFGPTQRDHTQFNNTYTPRYSRHGERADLTKHRTPYDGKRGDWHGHSKGNRWGNVGIGPLFLDPAFAVHLNRNSLVVAPTQ